MSTKAVSTSLKTPAISLNIFSGVFGAAYEPSQHFLLQKKLYVVTAEVDLSSRDIWNELERLYWWRLVCGTGISGIYEVEGRWNAVYPTGLSVNNLPAADTGSFPGNTLLQVHPEPVRNVDISSTEFHFSKFKTMKNTFSFR